MKIEEQGPGNRECEPIRFPRSQKRDLGPPVCVPGTEPQRSALFRSGISDGAADRCDYGEESRDQRCDAERVLERGGQERFKVEGAGEVGEPGKALLRLPDEEGHGGDEAEGCGEGLRSNEGALQAFDGRVAATKLSSPPEDAGGFEARCGLGADAGRILAEGPGQQNELCAGLAFGGMRTQVGGGSGGPAAPLKQALDFGMAGAGAEWHRHFHSGPRFRRTLMLDIRVRKQAGHLAAGAEEQKADTGGGEAGDGRDLRVRVALGIRQPKQLAGAGAKLREGWTEGECAIGLSGSVRRDADRLRNLVDRSVTGTAPVVAEQVCADAKEVTARGDVAVGWRVSGEEADEAFLDEVVGQGRVA